MRVTVLLESFWSRSPMHSDATVWPRPLLLQLVRGQAPPRRPLSVGDRKQISVFFFPGGGGDNIFYFFKGNFSRRVILRFYSRVSDMALIVYLFWICSPIQPTIVTIQPTIAGQAPPSRSPSVGDRKPKQISVAFFWAGGATTDFG